MTPASSDTSASGPATKTGSTRACRSAHPIVDLDVPKTAIICFAGFHLARIFI